MQLDVKERGFSFMKEGPLDMRMDLSSKLTAKEIVNKWSEKDLGKLFLTLGEERQWKKAAKAIVIARKKAPIETTKQLSDILSASLYRSKKTLNPSTLIFQALRMHVNKELDSIETGIKDAISILNPQGRIGVISFHRLEDRIVKNLFKTASKPIKTIMENATLMPLLKLITKKPLRPSIGEIKKNKRSRSARLRCAEKC